MGRQRSATLEKQSHVSQKTDDCATQQTSVMVAAPGAILGAQSVLAHESLVCVASGLVLCLCFLHPHDQEVEELVHLLIC